VVADQWRHRFLFVGTGLSPPESAGERSYI
jgi:hypothetical protein